jgi:hypothetical protein
VTADNGVIATKAALAGLEAAAGDWPSDLGDRKRAWRRVGVQKEYSKQAALLDTIDATPFYDDQTITKLREDLAPAVTPKRSNRARAPAKRRRVDEDSIDGWRATVCAYLKRSAAHRIAFVAALAERSLAARGSPAAPGEGQPDLPNLVLDAVWQAAKGRQLAAAERHELRAELQRAEPDCRAPEAWPARVAWRLLELALACCESPDNSGTAEEAAVVAYERVAGSGARNDPEVWKNRLRRPDIHAETMKQMTLLMCLSTTLVVDDRIVALIRRPLSRIGCNADHRSK